MHIKVLALDYDGTLTLDGTLSPETWAALRRAQAAGLVLMLVTGRRLNHLPEQVYHADVFAAIVAENGAVVSFPTRSSVALPFGQLAPALMQALLTLGVPFERGLALMATWEPYGQAVTDAVRRAGGGAVIEFNKGAVMVLPPGATKGSGLLYALNELGYSLHDTLTCGDADNDHSMFVMAEVAVAVSNATASVKTLADVTLPGVADAGVQALIASLVGDAPPLQLRPRAERDLTLGLDEHGQPVTVQADLLRNGTFGILGASQSGKSWLAGLMLEQLTGLGYQCCVIDPEGDYRTLRALPHVLVLGGTEAQLPDVTTVLTIQEYASVSVVLDFSLSSTDARNTYVTALLRALKALRHSRGRPHWILIDELQNFCQQEDPELLQALHHAAQEGGFAFITYRPAQVPPSLLAATHHWLLTPLRLSEDLTVIRDVLTAQGQDAAAVCSQLLEVSRGNAVLCSCEPPVIRWVPFRAAGRTSAHVRHLHKYLMAPLPSSKQFVFRDEQGTTWGRAASLWEFREALHTLPLGSLHFHLPRGDFEAWARGVLHDEPLASQLHKLAQTTPNTDTVREQLVEIVDEHYAQLERLT